MSSLGLETARTSLQAKVNEVWSQDADQRAQEQGWYWMAHPMVVARVNTLISGDPACDAYGRLERLYLERGWRLPIRQAVSLGCGFGNLERDLRRRGWVKEIAAYDLADGAIAQARRLADEAGLSGITYAVADLNTLRLEPGSADAVFAHSAIHHVQNLEHLYDTVHAALRPGGVFHLHEFVGPTRFQWTDAQIRLVNEFLDALPPRLRRLPSGQAKPAMRKPTVAEMIAADPTEAVRSAELVDALDPWFEFAEQRRTGGTLLHLALGDIAQNFDAANAEDCATLRKLFALEDRAMSEGVIGSDFAVLTALPRPQKRVPPARPRSVTTRIRTDVHMLALPEHFRFAGIERAVAAGNSMYDGDDAQYLAVGLSALGAIERALDGRTPRNILDLPCGYGRITRVLRARYPNARITVCDLDRSGADFSAATFGARAAYSSQDFRQLNLDETYDLIWAGSLVTHLSEAQTRAFLEAMARHATPTATLVVTSHGPSIARDLLRGQYGIAQLADVTGLLADYRVRHYGHRGYDGSDGYGISITDRDWWQRAVSGTRLQLHAFIERGWNDHQDVVTLGIRSLTGYLKTRAMSAVPARLRGKVWAEAQVPTSTEQFDPAYYLSANPDVAEAVNAGDFANGWEHYSRFGFAEGRSPAPDGPSRRPAETETVSASSAARDPSDPGRRAFIRSLHQEMLGRDIDAATLDRLAREWEGVTAEEAYSRIVRSEEYQARKTPIPLFVPPGHFYSPITDPRELARQESRIFDDRHAPTGISLREAEQLAYLDRMAAAYSALELPVTARPAARFHYDNPAFSYGDAITLGCTLLLHRPSNIIEVGSGFSSALMLDVIDRDPGYKSRCLFVEPYPERLEQLLLPGDRDSIEITRAFVQDVDLATYDRLGPDDILFIEFDPCRQNGKRCRTSCHAGSASAQARGPHPFSRHILPVRVSEGVGIERKPVVERTLLYSGLS